MDMPTQVAKIVCGPDACEALGLGLDRVTGQVHLGSQPDPVSCLGSQC